MKIVGEYSFNNGKRVIETRYPALLAEVKDVIGHVDSSICRNKVSKESTMNGKMLYAPFELNRDFKIQFNKHDWHNYTIPCDYSNKYYINGYRSYIPPDRRPYRDMDFVKQRMGVEVQFGKYAFMVYNVAAKMTIFHNLNIIDVGVEIVPVKAFADCMSTGVSYFEQFTWDLEKRGSADIDIPVLIFGITE